jgi:uncharacterized protein (TIGR02147 family)
VDRPSPFQFADYKAFLAAMQAHGRGETRRMSEAAGCQRSYFSQVIHGNAQLTPDHGYKLCKYLEFTIRERDFFLTQLEHARAATAEYRKHLEEKLNQLKREHEDLGAHVDRPKLKDSSQHLSYFSTWYWCAIHLLTSITEFQKSAAIARRLHLPESLVMEALEVLAEQGLVRRVGSSWEYASGEMHVAKESPLVSLHHNNWRQRAVLSAQVPSARNMHYTQVQSMSREAYEKIRTMVLKFIDEATKEAGPSTGEELVAVNIDIFPV